MSKKDYSVSEKESPPSVEEIKQIIRDQVEDTISFCTQEQEENNFLGVEKKLQNQISHLGCLFFQLYLMYFQKRLDYSKWLDSGLYYMGNLVGRNIKTIYGEVHFWRNYLIRKDKKGGVFYPLDTEIGLTRDGFSPLVMNLATKLATRVSFGVGCPKTPVLDCIFSRFLDPGKSLIIQF